jgi:cyclopropane-fatty-acyl-phospholipid synthase
VEIRLQDYREVEERFDRVVSIGMFEHVGVPNYEAYFRKAMSLLPDDGVALVHSIGRKGGPSATDPWTRKHVFPGGYSPALSETLAAVEKAGFWVADIETWRMHYAHTLEQWGERFQARRDEADAMLGPRFCRMWEFYLAAAEMSFRHGKHMNFQLQLTPTVGALPIARDYMGQAEAALAKAPGKPAEAVRAGA